MASSHRSRGAPRLAPPLVLLLGALLALIGCGSAPESATGGHSSTSTPSTGGAGGTGGTGGADAGPGDAGPDGDAGQGGGGGAACALDTDCAGATPKCDPATHQCVTCVSAGDCGSPALACDPSTNTCEVACTTSADCPEARPVCNAVAGVCVAGNCTKEFGCFGWQEGTWGTCSGGTCSGGGVQTRTVSCLDSAGNVAADSACGQPKPSTSQSCADLSACFYEWVGAWGACSNTCGVGVQSRSLTCQRSDGVTVADSFCPQPKPAASQPCTGDSTCAYQWVGTWGACSATCGAGTQTRTVTCHRASDGVVVADSFCSALPKPPESQACTGQSTCTYSWVPSSWGTCNTTCGTGVSTRTLTCVRSDGTTVADSFCQAQPKPAVTQPCTDNSVCSYQWVGSWGACSATCGAGTQTRNLTCQRADGTTVADSFCPQPKPPTSQACNGTSSCSYQWVGTWGACSATCGAGTQTRTLTCQKVSDGSTVADSFCQGVPQPPTSQACTGFGGCTYSWIGSGFGACSGACGGGTQTQTVSCRRSDGAPAPDSACDPTTKPPTSQSCTSGPCPPPTCTLSITPSSGGASTLFAATWASSSNGVTFDYSFDGGPFAAAPPTGWMQFAGSGYAVGAHTFDVRVTNSDGVGTCSTGFSVLPAPTCSVAVNPVTGDPSTTFTATWTSANATSCTWSLNGVPQGSVACDGSSSFVGSSLGTGSFAVVVDATGPGGAGTCSTSFSVGATGSPVCSLAVTPSTGGYTTANGGTNTSFTATWSSANATTCTWTMDGVPQGAIPCSGTTTFLGSQFGKGTHSASIQVSGPGGSSSCSTSVSMVDPPTCTLTASPTSGLTTTTFSATWSSSSDATGGTFYLDGTSLGGGSCAAGYCNGSTTFTGAQAGVGSHTITFKPTGPGGTGTCSFSLYVGTPNPPTCTVSVSPSSGYTPTTYNATWSSSSDATSCTYTLDGVSMGAVSCAGGTPFTGASVGAGNHSITLRPTGPGGTGACSSSFQVIGAPTCSVSASAGGVSWGAQNATDCSFNGSALPCSGSQPGPIPSGTYCMIANNPSGSTQCCGTVP